MPPNSGRVRVKFYYFQKIMELENLTPDYKWILKLNSIYWKAYLKWLRPNEGAGQTLAKLKKMGIKTGIITNFGAEIQTRKLIAINLVKYINVMVTAEEAGVTKPNPKIFQMALDRIGEHPEKTLMVGDDIIPDIKGAANAGMETILIENSWYPYTDTERAMATYRINNLREILEILN